MLVKMLSTMAGPAGTANAGSTVDLPTAQAYALIEGGYAEQIGAAAPSEDAAAETAAAPAAETAAIRKTKRR